jgi:hypothetical protein
VLRAVTFAPDIIAPLESVTRPTIVAVDCANTDVEYINVSRVSIETRILEPPNDHPFPNVMLDGCMDAKAKRNI